jgi:hypothetical protein
MLVKLQRPKDTPFWGVFVFGTGVGCGNVFLVIIQLLCPAKPTERPSDMISTCFTPLFVILYNTNFITVLIKLGLKFFDNDDDE